MSRKSMLSLLLAAIMLLSLLSGCGETAAEPTQAPATQAPATQAPSTPDEPDTPDEPVSMYPLVEGDPMEITAFFTVGNFVTMHLPDEDFNNIAAIKAANEACNVWMDVIMYDATFYKEQLYIMLAGGEYPDLLHQPEKYYTGGIEALINEEICIDLVPYMEEYMPDYYNNVYNADDIYAKKITSDEGHVVTIWGRVGAIKAGSVIRQDWLDDLNLEVPTTFDELHDVLMAFKTEKGADQAIMRTNGIIGSYTDSNFVGGYDNLVTSSNNSDIPWVIGDDGKVVCSYMKPSFQGYIQMLADWYQDGLYSDDSFSLDGNPTTWFNYIHNNRTGYWVAATSTLTSSFAANVVDPNFKAAAMADVTLNEGDSIDVGNSRGILGDGGWAITTQCEQVENVCKYMNWFFTEEGHHISNYGVEGEAHYVDADGKIQYNDVILHNENGASTMATTAIYCNFFQNPFDRTVWSLAATLDESARSCFDTWTANRTEDKVYQGVLTPEETELYNSKVGDIATYASEKLSALCHGDMDVAEFWPEFTAQLESMGIAELTAAKQAAYDRYMAR